MNRLLRALFNAVRQSEIERATANFLNSEYVPKKTLPATKLVRVEAKEPGKLYPLFVHATEEMPVGEWLPARAGEKAGKSKVKSSIGKLAYRPAWHATELPFSTHIGAKSASQKAKRREIQSLRDALYEKNDLFRENFAEGDAGLRKFQREKKRLMGDDPQYKFPAWTNRVTVRPYNQVWAEVELADDVDWQSLANALGTNQKGDLIARLAHITDRIPYGGFYRYKTNPNMQGKWLVGGHMKINRLIPDAEAVEMSLRAGGRRDLRRMRRPPDWVLESWRNGGDLSGF